MLHKRNLSRRLLLIDGRGVENESTALEVSRNFFQESIGGDWQNHEVEVLSGPTLSKDSIVSFILALSPVDYCIVTCVGRVIRVKGDRPWTETHLVLSNGDHVSERELNTGSPKILFIFDGCAQFISQAQIIIRNEKLKHGGVNTRRDVYEAATIAAEGGIVKLCYHTPEHPADSDFSLLVALVVTARDWVNSYTGVLSFDRALEQLGCHDEYLLNYEKVQYTPGRRLRHYPLAIS